MRILDFGDDPTIRLSEIEILSYASFSDEIDQCLASPDQYVLAYFGIRDGSAVLCICIMALATTGELGVFGHRVDSQASEPQVALAARHPSFERFERELHEAHGLTFSGHPWLKPVRFDSVDSNASIPSMTDFPFMQVAGEEVHEVGVGPIHAGIIEPAHFRFQCHGEQILHLEIQMGYQHRGVESAICETNRLIRQTILVESICGDSVIGHSAAFSAGIEGLAGFTLTSGMAWTRTLGLELERIAMHIGDLSAMCTDVGFQLGSAVLGALRTPVINLTQRLCGSRTGRGFVRPMTNPVRIDLQTLREMTQELAQVEDKLKQACATIFNHRSLLHRFENTGTLSQADALALGVVGMVARSCGIARDTRMSHPSVLYRDLPYKAVTADTGDVFARAEVRRLELMASFEYVRELIDCWPGSTGSAAAHKPLSLNPDRMSVSLIEGWRGVICHVAITDSTGEISTYKIVDPSFHNWHAETVAIRHNEISDFPICNKSFNLSYCGHDL